MTEHHYPKVGLVKDYLRAAGGLILTTAPFFMVEMGPVISTILALVVILFTGYGVSTWHRQHTTIHLGKEGILTHGLFIKNVAWSELEELKLSYYSTQRDKREGWMQLVLSGGGVRLKLDSTLQGFDQIVGRAITEAEARHLQFSETTVANLRSLGFELTGAEMQEGA